MKTGSDRGVQRFDAFDIDGMSVAAPATVETSRLLALTIDQELSRSPSRALAIVSAYRSEGRSTVAELVARGLSEVSPPVALIDADPLGRGLPGRNQHNLATSVGADGPIRALEIIGVPVVALSSRNQYLSEIEAVISSAVAVGVTPILDTPACTESSLAFVISRVAGRVLYVARRRRRHVESSVYGVIRRQFERIGVQSVGLVLNEW
jgi:hypothetical protein